MCFNRPLRRAARAQRLGERECREEGSARHAGRVLLLWYASVLFYITKSIAALTHLDLTHANWYGY